MAAIVRQIAVGWDKLALASAGPPLTACMVGRRSQARLSHPTHDAEPRRKQGLPLNLATLGASPAEKTLSRPARVSQSIVPATGTSPVERKRRGRNPRLS